MTLAFAPIDGALTALTVGVELPCRQYDPDLWFADAPADLEVAKALCGGCPLKVECLAGATVKIDNYMGTIAAAAAEGATTSRKAISAASALRVQTVQGDMVKGGNARGIPPRGTPV